MKAIAAVLMLLTGCAQTPPPPTPCAVTDYASVQPSDLLASADDGTTVLTVWRDASGVIRVLEATKNGACEVYTGTDLNGVIPL